MKKKLNKKSCFGCGQIHPKDWQCPPYRRPYTEYEKRKIREMKKNKKYPDVVCRDCGLKASKGRCHSLSTYYEDKCDICGKVKSVTQARDFFYPKFEGRK